MLSALISAPGTMVRNAGVYITVFFIVLFQTLIFQFLPDALAFVEQTFSLSPETVGGEIFSIGGVLLFVFVQLTLSLYILAVVSPIAGGNKNAYARTTSANASLISLARLAAVMLIVGGALLVTASMMLQLLTQTNGIISILLFLVVMIILLALFGGLVLFGFAPSFMGRGFAIREALAQSWKLSTMNLWEVVLLFIALVFIAGIGESIIPLATDALSNEWIILLVNALLVALLAYYSATVLGNAIPSTITPETTTASSTPYRHHFPKK